MSSNKEQKRTKKIMPPGKSQDVHCLFCCWTPPKFEKLNTNATNLKFGPLFVGSMLFFVSHLANFVDQSEIMFALYVDLTFVENIVSSFSIFAIIVLL